MTEVLVAFFMLIHASPDAPPVDIYVDGNLIVESMAYGDSRGYAPIEAGEHTMVIKKAGTDEVVFGPAARNLKKDKVYAFVGMGLVGGDPGFDVMAYEDDFRLPEKGKFFVRAIHAVPDVGKVDIYVDDSLFIPGLGYAKCTPYKEHTAAEYVVHVQNAGGSEVLLDPLKVNLKEGKVYTVIAIGEAGKDSVEVKLVEDADPGDAPPVVLDSPASLVPDKIE